jgi:hypothetical protein
MLSEPQYCPNENASGHICTFGPGHAGNHNFKPLKLTEAQLDALEDVARFPVRQYQCIDLSSVATLKALYRRGFIHLRYINSRRWDASLKPAGRRVLDELPR